jgi:hypothetical protein
MRTSAPSTATTLFLAGVSCTVKIEVAVLAAVSPNLGGLDEKRVAEEELNKRPGAFLLPGVDDSDEEKIEEDGVFSMTMRDGVGCAPNSDLGFAGVYETVEGGCAPNSGLGFADIVDAVEGGCALDRGLDFHDMSKATEDFCAAGGADAAGWASRISPRRDEKAVGTSFLTLG